MKKNKLKRIATGTGITLVILILVLVTGLHFAAQMLKTRIEAALGTESEVAEIAVGWSSIEIRGIRIRAPQGWPAPDSLRAEKITIAPDLFGLISAKVLIHKITVENAYVSVLRPRDGRLRLLPSLLEKSVDKHDDTVVPASSTRPAPVSIGAIELRGGVLEFFDASVRQPAHKIRLEQLHADLKDLHLPDLSGKTAVHLEGMIKGMQHDGKLSIDGWSELSAKNSQIGTTLRGVDLTALQPYLIKAAETGVRRGTLDLDLQSTVRDNQLHAPGTLTLTDLELSAGGGSFGTFMGVPRQAVVAALQDKNGRITVKFTLSGNLDDPHFSLNESFAKNLGASVAGLLGISIEGLTRNVGGAAAGIGNAVKRLFGK